MTPPRVLGLAGLLAVAACAADPAGSDRAPATATLAIRAVFPPAAQGAFAGLVVDGARVAVRRRETVILDTTAVFPATASSIALSLRVPLASRTERLGVDLTLAGGSTPLFAGSAEVDVTASGDGSPARPTIPLLYVGPGANVATLQIAPNDTLVPPGSSLGLGVSAWDGSGNPVPQFYVTWSSSDPRVAVGVDGRVTLPADRTLVTIGARTPTGVSATATLVASPPPTAIAVRSGDNQSGTVGGPLPSDLAVQVTSADGGGVPGVPVHFLSTAVTPGDTTVRTDLGGVARLLPTLGTVAGPATVTVAASGLPANVTFHLTATAGAVATLVPAGGAGQIGTVAAPLPLALAVLALDQYGNAVAGAAVQWTAVEGAGSVAPAGAITDAQGVARAQLIPGPLPVVNVAQAVVPGASAAYRFAALADPGPPGVAFELFGSGDTDGAPAVPLMAQIRDGLGNPVAGVPVSWQIVSGGGQFQSASLVSGPGGLVAATLLPAVGVFLIVPRVSVVSSSVFADFTVTQGTPNTRISVVGGGSQSGIAGQPVSQPVVVEVLNSDFEPVPDLSIAWSVAAGAGTFTPASGVTDASGHVSQTYVAGPVAGRQVGRVVEPTSLVASVGIWDIGPGSVAEVLPFSGDGQTGVVGSPLRTDLVALVADGFGNPVPGVTLTWSAPSGSFAATTATTDARGLARVRFTPGALGGVDVEARDLATGAAARFRIVAR